MTAAKNVRLKTPHLLEAFRFALDEFLDDTEAVYGLAARLRLMPVGRSPDDTATHAASKIALDVSGLTPRPELLESCRHVLEATGRVCLVGDRGTGKSSLAMMLAAAISSEQDPIVLRRSQLMDCVVSELASHGMPTRGSDRAALLHDFAYLVRSAPSQLLVLDGFDDWPLVERLIPDGSRRGVLVTSSQRPPDDWKPHLVQVPDMTTSEADELAQRSTSRLSDLQRDSLIRVLRYRPIAIAQACGFLERTSAVSPDALQKMFERRMALALETVAESTERNLGVLHKRTVEELEATYPAAARLLEFICFAPVLKHDQGFFDDESSHYEEEEGEEQHRYHEKFAIGYLMLVLDLQPDDLDSGIIVHERAMGVLRDRYIVRGGNDDASLHGVVAAIFRALFQTFANRIERQLRDVLYATSVAGALDRLEWEEQAKERFLRWLQDYEPDDHRVVTQVWERPELYRDDRLVRIMRSLIITERGGE